jgi:ABC-2 type transport system ATP-binding protein
MFRAIRKSNHPEEPEPFTGGAPAAILSDRPTIVFQGVSKWYGDLVAVSDISFSIGAGVTALLGPNGSGKTTSLKIVCGLLAPSTGTVSILGHPARGVPAAYRNLGVVLDQEHVYPWLTGREFVRMNALLQQLSDPDAAVDRALDIVEMKAPSNRKTGGYSKGMRQRIKLAAALVHDPDILLMDEPLNGTDPEQRAHMILLIRELGAMGKTLLISSHVLVEVERFAENILVIINGKLAAAGNYRTIRDRIDNRPHVVRIRATDPRRLAAALVTIPSTTSVKIDRDNRLLAETSDVRAFYTAVPKLAQAGEIRLTELQAADESLESVFSYLVER